MTMNDHPRLMSADQTTTGTTDHYRGEVRTVAKRSRQRAWDEMSEIDRAVLLENVRQRRRLQARRRSVENDLYLARSMR